MGGAGMDQDYMLHSKLKPYNKEVIDSNFINYLQREQLGQPQCGRGWHESGLSVTHRIKNIE
jgi:hypothetical protein